MADQGGKVISFRVPFDTELVNGYSGRDCLVCPWCDEEHATHRIVAEGLLDGQLECRSCKREFLYRADFAYVWSTQKAY